jgi:hypothetical protein
LLFAVIQMLRSTVTPTIVSATHILVLRSQTVC